MRTFRIAILMLVAMLLLLTCNAQENVYASIFKRQPASTGNAALRLYGGLSHQHQNYFNKAFSLQGIEGGVISVSYTHLDVYKRQFL